MKRFKHAILIASTLVLPLAGCSSLPDFNGDPTEWFNFDFFNNKKPLAGQRKPLFPDGVPGVASGVPQELVKGNQPPPGTDIAQEPPVQEAAVQEEPKPDPKPKAKPRPKPTPKVAAKTASPASPAPPAGPASQSTTTRVTVGRSESQWPEPPPTQPQAPQQQPAGAQWPAAPPGPQSAAPPAVQWPDPPAPR